MNQKQKKEFGIRIEELILEKYVELKSSSIADVESDNNVYEIKAMLPIVKDGKKNGSNIARVNRAYVSTDAHIKLGKSNKNAFYLFVLCSSPESIENIKIASYELIDYIYYKSKKENESRLCFKVPMSIMGTLQDFDIAYCNDIAQYYNRQARRALGLDRG